MLQTTLCYIEQEGQILLLHRNKKENDLNEGKWIGVGGKFEKDETVEECLVREVFEETGLTLTAYEYIGLIKFESDRYEAEDMHLFIGTAFTGTLKEDCNEGTLHWVPKEQVIDLPTWEGDRFFLKPMLEGKKGLHMRLRYEGDTLVLKEDNTKTPQSDRSTLIKAPHGFSTRIGGFSDGIYDSMNLGMRRGDIPERVTENWKHFLSSCGISYRPFVSAHQVHGNTVHVATYKDAVLPSDAQNPNFGYTPLEVDGFVTDQPGLPIVIYTADCVPVLLEDAPAGVIGAVHCGWRSTVADIEKEVLHKMQSLGANIEDIVVCIGSAIDVCCFEVGLEVIDAAIALLGENDAKPFYFKKPNGKFMLDLRSVVEKRFLQLGILSSHIEKVGSCTMCHPDRYFSHRYTNGRRGSQANVIMLPANPIQ